MPDTPTQEALTQALPAHVSTHSTPQEQLVILHQDLAMYRKQIQAGTLSTEKMVEIIAALREKRRLASTLSDNSRAKKRPTSLCTCATDAGPAQDCPLCLGTGKPKKPKAVKAKKAGAPVRDAQALLNLFSPKEGV